MGDRRGDPHGASPLALSASALRAEELPERRVVAHRLEIGVGIAERAGRPEEEDALRDRLSQQRDGALALAENRGDLRSGVALSAEHVRRREGGKEP